MCCLLQEHSVWPIYLTDVNGYSLVGYERLVFVVRGGKLTNFCAEKMAFIIGMYDVARSGETERIRIRGSGRVAGSTLSADLLVPVGGDEVVIRLTSGKIMNEWVYRVINT